MQKLTILPLAIVLATGFSAISAAAGTDRIITGSNATPPAFVEVGPQQFERYDIATAPVSAQPGGTDGIMTGSEKPLVPLARSRSFGYETSVSDYPGASGYLPDGRVDP